MWTSKCEHAHHTLFRSQKFFDTNYNVAIYMKRCDHHCVHRWPHIKHNYTHITVSRSHVTYHGVHPGHSVHGSFFEASYNVTEFTLPVASLWLRPLSDLVLVLDGSKFQTGISSKWPFILETYKPWLSLRSIVLTILWLSRDIGVLQWRYSDPEKYLDLKFTRRPKRMSRFKWLR